MSAPGLPSPSDPAALTIRARTLHVDRNTSGDGHAASLEEAIARLIADDYTTIVLHRHGPEWDEYGVVAYLAGTWPQFLRGITVRSISRDGAAAIWNSATARFEREVPPPPRPRLAWKRPRERNHAEAAV